MRIKRKKTFQQKAIVVGSKGQDGTILCKKLKKMKFKIYKINKQNFNINNINKVIDIVKKNQPNQIYYLAAYHHSSEDRSINKATIFSKTMKINLKPVIFFLDAIKTFSPKTKFFYASSSLVFAPSTSKQNENTQLNPKGYYALSKVSAMNVCKYYRKFKKIFVSVGILYNHESSLRKKNFLSKKIVTAAAQIAFKRKGFLEIGNLNSKVDWGYADDYVDAMIKIMKLKKPNDFVIASGKSHTVREFVKKVFEFFGLNYKEYIKVNPKILYRNEKKERVGDTSRLKKLTGWKPSINFSSMIKKLAQKEKLIYGK